MQIELMCKKNHFSWCPIEMNVFRSGKIWLLKFINWKIMIVLVQTTNTHSDSIWIYIDMTNGFGFEFFFRASNLSYWLKFDWTFRATASVSAHEQLQFKWKVINSNLALTLTNTLPSRAKLPIPKTGRRAWIFLDISSNYKHNQQQLTWTFHSVLHSDGIPKIYEHNYVVWLSLLNATFPLFALHFYVWTELIRSGGQHIFCVAVLFYSFHFKAQFKNPLELHSFVQNLSNIWIFFWLNYLIQNDWIVGVISNSMNNQCRIVNLQFKMKMISECNRQRYWWR